MIFRLFSQDFLAKKPQISNFIPLQYMFRPSGFDHMLNKTIFLDDIFDMFNEGKLCLHDFLSIHKKWKFEPLLFSLLLLALVTRDMFCILCSSCFSIGNPCLFYFYFILFYFFENCCLYKTRLLVTESLKKI